jgi:NADH-quinone oxidoreductase subunit M
MVFLTALLSFLCVFVSWKIDKAPKGYFALFLLLDAGMWVCFFLSISSCSMYLGSDAAPYVFLIGMWGGPQREYAAIKFFLYTLAGSVLMLVAILALYFTCGHTFDMTVLMAQANDGLGSMTWWGFNALKVVWIMLFIAFAIKVPVFPFHTWLPLAHVEAPTAVSVILAGVLLKWVPTECFESVIPCCLMVPSGSPVRWHCWPSSTSFGVHCVLWLKLT